MVQSAILLSDRLMGLRRQSFDLALSAGELQARAGSVLVDAVWQLARNDPGLLDALKACDTPGRLALYNEVLEHHADVPLIAWAKQESARLRAEAGEIAGELEVSAAEITALSLLTALE